MALCHIPPLIPELYESNSAIFTSGVQTCYVLNSFYHYIVYSCYVPRNASVLGVPRKRLDTNLINLMTTKVHRN